MQIVPEDWHEHFFEGLWLEVQPRSFPEEQTRADASAVQEFLQLMPGAKVLDAPCGDGRVALELAARGFEVTGVDRSAFLLDRARETARRRSLEVHWVEGDMWRLDVKGRFDAALCLWHSWGYGREDQDLAYFRAVAERLRPGAALLLEGHVAESLLPQWEERSWREAGDVLVAEARDYDAEHSRIVTEWTLAGPHGVEKRHSSIRIYTFRELQDMLRAAGFAEFEACGSFDLEPFELGCSRLVLAARRGD